MPALPEIETNDPDVVVAQVERSSHLDMTLLWMTMTASFPTVLAGFEWYRLGISLQQVIVFSIIACSFLLAYSVPASYIGSRSGLSYSSLSKMVFGSGLAKLVIVNNIWVMLAWYGLGALCVVDALRSIAPIGISPPIACFVCGLLMAVNNFFGFKGIANFARFVAAPVLLIWILVAFSKCLPDLPHAFFLSGAAAPALAFSTVCNFITGFAVWGIEPDFWRYGPNKRFSAFWPIAIALSLGELIFPVTGWLCASSCQLAGSAEFTHYMYEFCFGAFSVLVLTVLLPSYFAVNDSNLFGMLGAVELFRPGKRRLKIACIALVGSVLAYCLAQFGMGNALASIASLNGVLLPTATSIMVVELLLIRKTCQEHPRFRIAGFQWPALIALLAGYAVGIVTSGIIPGLEKLHVGICTVQAWICAAAVYFVLRRMALRAKA
jgi:purine-cytosine permease-like protein